MLWVWQFIYGDSDGSAKDAAAHSLHETEEAAARAAVGYIIQNEFGCLEPSDESHAEAARLFLQHAEAGDFIAAVRSWQESIEKNDWDETLKIEKVRVVPEFELPGLVEVRTAKKDWEARLEVSDG